MLSRKSERKREREGGREGGRAREKEKERSQILHGERDEIDGDATGRGWEILRIVSGVI